MANTVSRLINDDTLNRIIQIESAGNPNARASTSSAAGLGQFLSATWVDTVRKHKPQLLRTNTREDVIKMRVGVDTAPLQLEMLARFTEDNARFLGAGYSDGDLYLAHFLGTGDARRLLRAPPSDLASNHVTAGAVAANHKILAGKTCNEVRSWAQASMETRWTKAGRPDWVMKYIGPQPTPIPDVPPIETKPAPKGAIPETAGGAIVVGGGAIVVTEAVNRGASWGDIALIVIPCLIIAAAVFVIIRHARKG